MTVNTGYSKSGRHCIHYTHSYIYIFFFPQSFIKTIDNLIIFQWNEEENNKKVYLFFFGCGDRRLYCSFFYLIIARGQRLRSASELGFDTDSAYIIKNQFEAG